MGNLRWCAGRSGFAGGRAHGAGRWGLRSSHGGHCWMPWGRRSLRCWPGRGDLFRRKSPKIGKSGKQKVEIYETKTSGETQSAGELGAGPDCRRLVPGVRGEMWHQSAHGETFPAVPSAFTGGGGHAKSVDAAAARRVKYRRHHAVVLAVAGHMAAFVGGIALVVTG